MREHGREAKLGAAAAGRNAGPQRGVQHDDLKLLVAASAVTLSVGWPDYEWDRLTEVLLYPDDFDRDYNLEPGD